MYFSIFFPHFRELISLCRLLCFPLQRTCWQPLGRAELGQQPSLAWPSAGLQVHVGSGHPTTRMQDGSISELGGVLRYRAQQRSLPAVPLVRGSCLHTSHDMLLTHSFPRQIFCLGLIPYTEQNRLPCDSAHRSWLCPFRLHRTLFILCLGAPFRELQMCQCPPRSLGVSGPGSWAVASTVPEPNTAPM